MHKVNYNSWTSYVSTEQLLLMLYLTGRTVIWWWARPVSDS